MVRSAQRQQDAVAAPLPLGAWSISLCLFVTAAILLAFRSRVATAVHLYDATPATFPWFMAEHAWLLYVTAPLAIVASIILVLAPGLVVVWRRGQATSFEELLLKGFLVSAALHMGFATVWVGTGGVLRPDAFSAWAILVPFACLLWPVRPGARDADLALARPDAIRLGLHIAMALVPLLVLAPLFYWQELTGDGAELLYVAQSLDSNVIPRFTDPTPMATLGTGMIFQSIAASWFLNLFGGTPVAVRFLAVFFLPLLFSAVLLLVERGSARVLRNAESVALAVALLVILVTLALNASYNPYATDIGSPTGVELGTVVLALTTLHFFQTQRWPWFFGAVALGLLCRPLEVVVLVALGLATLAEGRPVRAKLLPLLLAGVVAVGLGALLQLLQGGEEPFNNPPLDRFEYIRILDVRQLLITVVGAGVVPVLALTRFRHWDATGRVLAAVLGLTFIVVYLPAFYALHHMALLFVLFVTLFWRSVANGLGTRWVAASLAGSAVAFTLALPTGPVVSRVHRDVAETIYNTVGAMDGTFEERRQAVRAAHALDQVFPGVDGQEGTVFRGNWLVLAYHAPSEPTERTRFEIRSAGAEGTGTPIARGTHGSVWMRGDGGGGPAELGTYPVAFRSRLYAIPRSRLLRHVGVWDGDYGTHLGSFPVIWRMFAHSEAEAQPSDDQ